MRVLLAMTMAALLAVGLPGCATSDMQPHQQLLAKAAIQSASVRFIEADSDSAGRAENIIDVIDSITAVSDLESITTLDQFEELAREEIPWNELTPQDVILAEAMIEYIRIELDRSIDFEVDLAESLELQEVFSWVRDAALLYTERTE